MVILSKIESLYLMNMTKIQYTNIKKIVLPKNKNKVKLFI